MNRRLHCTIIVLLALVLCVPTQAAVRLTHFMYEGHAAKWQEYLEVMASRFKASTGIDVEVIVSSGGAADMRSKLLVMIAGGTPPDVTDAHPVIAAPLIAQGVFEDLRPYLTRDKFPLERIPPVAVEGMSTPDGQIWGIPASVYPVVTFFNMDMFAQQGLANPRELGAEWTWETLEAAARRLTIDVDGDGVPESYGTDRISSRWEMQVHQAGGQLYDRVVYPTKSQFNTPSVLRAVEFIQSLYLERLAVNTSTDRIYLGRTAFSVVDGPGFIGPYYQDVAFAWDIAGQPKGPANRAARVNPDGFQIIAESKHREEAWQWVRFLTGDADNQLDMARITGRLPSLREAMTRYPRAAANLKLPDNWQAMIETAFDPDGYAAYVVPEATQIDAVVNPIMNRVWNGQMAAAPALQQIHDVVTSILNQ
ncbi:MAG: ABC transporter substrate-binding protein [Limnochordia bacterium]|jgi:multiple sugar transport system substrate-binding protein